MKDIRTKKQQPNILIMIKRIFQIILYIPIQIIFIPVAIIGLITGFYKEKVNSRKLGVSYSAGQSLQFRFYMHYFNTRPDPLSVAFTKSFPCESHFGLWSVMGALIISQRLFGFKTRLAKVAEQSEANYAATAGSRVVAFDKIMEKYVNEMEQIVFPGVGFDLMALHFTEGKKVKVFELDQTNTLNIKVETMKKAGIKHDWISYIPVDYEKESWVDKLLEAGFDKTKKTLFIWQSVSLYLEPEIVRDALCKMADLCAEGSVIAQDFYSKSFINSKSFAVKSQKNMIEKMGELWKFGIEMTDRPKEAVESFLKDCGLQMTDYIQFGEKINIEPFYCIVEAEKL